MEEKTTKQKFEKKKIDWMITLVPFAIIVVLCILFIVQPDGSTNVLEVIRDFLGNKMGVYYLVIGLGFVLVALFLAFSKYGNIVLGKPNEKPKYSFFSWGCMMFTCGLAADILFYSFSEWAMYAGDPQIDKLGTLTEWGNVYSQFHWSFIPWAFYLVLAVAFGFMLHVRKREKQKYSEACRPILGKQTDKAGGRIIDLLAVFALIAGTATTFSVATPLMSQILSEMLNLSVDRRVIDIIILVVTCAIYTYSLLHGFKGINVLAKICIFLFFGLLAYVLIVGGKGRFIIENGFESFGRLIQNFVGLSTTVDPLRTEASFPQNWTTFYWAYWMVWCIAAPFFIGKISRGRTVRQTILGGMVFGVGSTIVSFIILGNYGIGLEAGGADLVAQYAESADWYGLIVAIIKTIPGAPFVLILVLVTMMLFYATSFDSIAYTASCYSYRRLEGNQQPHKLIQLMWCILLILLPIGLIFSESSMGNLQTVSIIAAFPVGIVMILMVASFFKDAKKYQTIDMAKFKDLEMPEIDENSIEVPNIGQGAE